MRKYATGRVISDDNEPIRRTAGARELTQDDVREIEREGEDKSQKE